MAKNNWLLDQIKENAKSVGRVLPIVRVQAATENAQAQSKRDKLGLHPSEISKKNWCPRSSWYTIEGYERPSETMSFGRLNVFAEGNAIHNKWQTWLRNAGVLRGLFKCQDCGNTKYSDFLACECGSTKIRYAEVPIENEEYNILGHADGIIEDKNGLSLIEIKSVGVGTIRYEAPDIFAPYAHNEITIDELWGKIRRPFPSHLRQANLYMFCTGISDLAFIYEWKPNQDVKEFNVRFQPELIESILVGCKDVKDRLGTKRPPMRPIWVTGPDCQTCKTCPYNKVCWGEDEPSSTNSTDDRSSEEVHRQVQPSEEAVSGPTGNPEGPRRIIRR